MEIRIKNKSKVFWTFILVVIVLATIGNLFRTYLPDVKGNPYFQITTFMLAMFVALLYIRLEVKEE